MGQDRGDQEQTGNEKTDQGGLVQDRTVRTAQQHNSTMQYRTEQDKGSQDGNNRKGQGPG